MVDVTPGNEGANKGYWRKQLRDKYGKFVRMGGAVLIELQLPGVQGILRATGRFRGMETPTVARIEVLDDREVPKGIYLVETSKIEAIQADLPEDYVERKTAEAKGEVAPEQPAQELKAAISGSEALKIRLKSVARALKQAGRFPIPRLAPTTDKGRNSDVANGAKIDYKKVFDAEPALQEKYKTFENMWEMVYKYGADERTQSPNTLAEIPEDMKELNRAYAKHVLGLNPDGIITVYRNAVNGKDTPEESAVGYVSLDREMAYDYNSHRDNVAANGRYEIDVKPDEVFGMIGYSKIEDEYGLTIGREVTNTPGRVRRVGDLGIVDIEAPWLREYGRNEFNRGRGASPFRMFNLAGEYDFHPVEPLGNNLEEFLQNYNLSAPQIKEKFEQLYGEGSYDRYKASGNTVTFQRIRDLFVPLEDDKIGLDVAKLNRLDALRNPNEYLDDLYDNTLKMLSVFQELTGQPFMTHKTRGYEPPEEAAISDKQDSIYEEFFDGGNIDLQSLAKSVDGVPKYDRDMFTEDQLKALETYGQAGYRQINKILRDGDALTDDQKKLIESIDEALAENGTLFSSARVYRGALPKSDSEYAKFLQNMEEGKTYSFPGYFSTSNDAQIAFSEFGPGIGSGDNDGSAAHLGPAFFWTIDIPQDGTAMAMPEGVGFGSGAESEVLLPRDSQFKILGIKKVKQVDDDGQYTGLDNYFIHAEQVPTTQGTPSTEERSDKLVDSVRRYTDGSGTYSLVNEYLRNGEQSWMTPSEIEDAKQIAKDLTQLIEASPGLEEEQIVYRGGDESLAQTLAKLSIGDTIVDNAIISTSEDSRVAEGFAVDDGAVMRVYLPAGTKTFSPYGYRTGSKEGDPESELLLAPGTKFKLVEINGNEYTFDLVQPSTEEDIFEGVEFEEIDLNEPSQPEPETLGIDLTGKRWNTESRTKLGYKKLAWENARNDKWDELKAANPSLTRDELQQQSENDPGVKALEREYLEDPIMVAAMKLQSVKGGAMGENYGIEEWGSPIFKLGHLAGVYADRQPRDLAPEMDRQYENLIKDDALLFPDPNFRVEVGGTGATKEEVIARAKKDWKEYISKSGIQIIMSASSVQRVITAGRVKTIHETDRPARSGASDDTYKDTRRVYENVAFGYDDSSAVETRPVSGLFGDGEPYSEYLGIYGGKTPAVIQLKPATKERSTYTLGDSLNGYMSPASVADPSEASMGEGAIRAGIYGIATGRNWYEDNKINAPEVQIHGGVYLEDIDMVVFYAPPSDSVLATLKRANIPYKIEVPTGMGGFKK